MVAMQLFLGGVRQGQKVDVPSYDDIPQFPDDRPAEAQLPSRG
jgi:hypothetical protein